MTVTLTGDTGADFIAIVKEYDLAKLVQVVLKESKSNGLPYHNFYHTQNMVVSAYKILKDAKKFGLKFFFNRTGETQILIAALFHDFNHSGGKYSDVHNIAQAMNKVRDLEKLMTIPENDAPANYVDFIAILISYTEFPYGEYFLEEELTDVTKAAAAILRDADLMQIFTPNYFQQNVMGLYEEFNNGKLAKTDFTTHMLNQRKFLSGLRFSLPKTGEIYKDKIIAKLRELDAMLEIWEVGTLDESI